MPAKGFLNDEQTKRLQQAGKTLADYVVGRSPKFPWLWQQLFVTQFLVASVGNQKLRDPVT